MRVYDQKQLDRQRLIEERKEALYQSVPRLAEIDRQIVHLNIQKAKNKALGKAGNDYAGELEALMLEKQQLMRSGGYDEHYLDPPYECPDCRDTGFIGRNRCHCFARAALDIVYDQSHLKGELDSDRFDTFSLSWYSDSRIDPVTGKTELETARDAEKACWEFTRNFDQRFENILLFGGTGLGKTFLSHCVARELLETGHSVIYFSASRLFDLLAQYTFRKEAEDVPEAQDLFTCDLLIIDDLGSELTNTLTVSSLFTLLNQRIRRQHSTLISTNLSLDELKEAYSERISSRILEQFTLLHLAGNDIRLQKKLL